MARPVLALTTLLSQVFLSLVFLALPLRAEPVYPQTTIRIVLGFSPGSAPDVAARILAERFTAAWGRPVVVENMLGAGGNIAADHVAKSAPDGATAMPRSSSTHRSTRSCRMTLRAISFRSPK